VNEVVVGTPKVVALAVEVLPKHLLRAGLGSLHSCRVSGSDDGAKHLRRERGRALAIVQPDRDRETVFGPKRREEASLKERSLAEAQVPLPGSSGTQSPHELVVLVSLEYTCSMSLTIQLHPSENQTAFNIKRWRQLLADPELARLPYRVETDRHGHILMRPSPVRQRSANRPSFARSFRHSSAS